MEDDESFVVDGIVSHNCRPPKNRQPRRRERDTCCDAYLSRQISAISPKIIVLMGRTAAQAVLGADSLKNVRGRVVRRGSVEYLCTYHPAAVVRNAKLRGALTKDLQLLRTVSEKYSRNTEVKPTRVPT